MFDSIVLSGVLGNSSYMMVIWIVVFLGIMYLFILRPQNKEKQRLSDMMNNMEVGDFVVTTSGFYGEVISITDDDVVVEFGNNKNCRIPMKKLAIAEIEKAGTAVVAPETKNSKDGKKDAKSQEANEAEVKEESAE